MIDFRCTVCDKSACTNWNHHNKTQSSHVQPYEYMNAKKTDSQCEMRVQLMNPLRKWAYSSHMHGWKEELCDDENSNEYINVSLASKITWLY